MAGAKEIRTQINSVKSTQKITSAMEMVAASKMRKAQQRMQVGKPYSQRIRAVISHVAGASPEYKHAYMSQRETVSRVGYIIVSSDRGLCGGLNSNMFRHAVKAMRDYHKQGIAIDICTIGGKAASFFGGQGANIIANVRDLGESPSVSQLIGAIKVMLNAYSSGQVDKVYVVGNEFVNTMSQLPFVRQLLPLVAEETEREHRWDYIYEGDAQVLLDALLTRYIESQVHQTVVENIACEQAARMVAMKSATDNAGDLIDDLQLIFNKARQAAITQELSEIVSGAAAV